MVENERNDVNLLVGGLARPEDPGGELFVDLALPLLEDLYRVACRLEGDRERARDLLQDALLLGYRKFGQLEERSSFRAWAVRILAAEPEVATLFARQAHSTSLPSDRRLTSTTKGKTLP